jgi:isoleucyl-tRNA synthetase
MAPVLSFTSEEIWQAMSPELRRSSLTSVHLAPFPEVTFVDPELERNWEQLLDIRSQVQGQLEVKRREKLIGSSQEAKVILYAQQGNPDLFIVSQVELHGVQNPPLKTENTHDLSMGLEVEVVRAQGAKCERCWNYRASVGSFPDHPTLCDRCIEAVR